MLVFIINNQLYFIIAIILLFIFFAIKVYRYETEEENTGNEVNILGFGKAEGLYLVKVGKYYLVAGMKIKSKHKAIKKFIALVEKNGFVPPKSYFKMVKVKNL
jgi:flagellar biogenesis protein FliO